MSLRDNVGAKHGMLSTTGYEPWEMTQERFYFFATITRNESWDKVDPGFVNEAMREIMEVLKPVLEQRWASYAARDKAMSAEQARMQSLHSQYNHTQQQALYKATQRYSSGYTTAPISPTPTSPTNPMVDLNLLEKLRKTLGLT